MALWASLKSLRPRLEASSLPKSLGVSRNIISHRLDFKLTSHYLGWCFWINLPLGAVTLLTVLFLVKIPTDPNRKTKGTIKGFLDRFDLIGTLVLIPWVICLLLALQWGGSQYSWRSWRIILLLVLFAVLFVLWVFIQYKQGNKATLPLRIIKQRSMASGMIYMFCLFSAFFVINYYVPIWFQSVKGVSAYKSGIYFLTMSAGLSLAVIASGLLVSRTEAVFQGVLS